MFDHITLPLEKKTQKSDTAGRSPMVHFVLLFFILTFTVLYVGFQVYLGLLPGSPGKASHVAWSGQTVMQNFDVGMFSSIVVNSATGNPAMAFYNTSLTSVMYATYVGNGTGSCLDTNWNCETVDSTGSTGWSPSIAITSTNIPAIAYIDQSNSRLKYAIRDGGAGGGCANSNWSCETVNTAGIVGNSRIVSLAFNASNQAGIGYGSISFALRDAGALGGGCLDSDWSCENFAAGSVYWISLVFRSDSIPAMTYYDSGSADLRFIIRDGGTFGGGCPDADWSCEVVETTNEVGAEPSIKFDNANRAAIAYRYATSSDLKYTLRVGAGGGSGCADTDWTCTTIDSTGNVGTMSSLAFQPTTNFAAIAYYDSGAQNLKFAINDGGAGAGCATVSWSCESVDTPNDVGQWPGLAFNLSNQAVVSYNSTSRGDVKFAVRNTSGTVCSDSDWSCGSVYDSGLIGGATYTSFAFDNNNIPSVAFFNISNTDASFQVLSYAKYVGNGTGNCYNKNWTCEDVDTTFTSGQYVSLSYNTSNQAGISYFNSSNGDLKFALRDGGTLGACSNSNWSCESVETTGNVGTASSLDFNASNRPAISYYDGSDNLKFAIRDSTQGGGCADADWSCVVVENGPVGVLGPTSLKFTSTNLANISFIDTGSVLKYATQSVISGSLCTNILWSCETVDSTVVVQNATSLDLNSTDVSAIAYYDSTNANLKVATRDSGVIGPGCSDTDWSCETVETIGVIGEHAFLKFNSQNKASVVYSDASNGYLKFSQRDSGAGGGGCADADWTCEVIDNGSGDIKVGRYNSFSITSAGTFGVSSSDSNLSGVVLRYYSGTVTNTAPVVGYTANNVIPSAQISQATDGTGIVNITFKLKDGESNAITLNTFQYSIDGGTTWSAPTNGDSSASLNGGNYISGISSPLVNWRANNSSYASATSFSTATAYTFHWNTKHADVSGITGTAQTDIRVRFTANDGTVNSSSPGTADNFAVDNLAPTTATNTNIVTRANAGATTVLLSVAFTETNPNTNVFSVQTNDGGYGVNTSGSTNTATPSNQSTALAASLDGDDCVTDVRTIHTDDFGNTVTAENIAPSNACVIPYTPATPTGSVNGNDSIMVIVQRNTLEIGAVQYAIRVRQGSSEQFVQTNGTLGASAAWQIYSSWGGGSGILVSGLQSAVTYRWDVKARNPNDPGNTETVYSSASEGSTGSSRRRLSDVPIEEEPQGDPKEDEDMKEELIQNEGNDQDSLIGNDEAVVLEEEIPEDETTLEDVESNGKLTPKYENYVVKKISYPEVCDSVLQPRDLRAELELRQEGKTFGGQIQNDPCILVFDVLRYQFEPGISNVKQRQRPMYVLIRTGLDKTKDIRSREGGAIDSGQLKNRMKITFDYQPDFFGKNIFPAHWNPKKQEWVMMNEEMTIDEQRKKISCWVDQLGVYSVVLK